MKKINKICTGGILTAITVIFQSAPVFLPVLGMALSPLSTLPVLLAAVLEIPVGLVVLISSALIVFAISPQEGMILLLTTGPLGIIIGSLLLRRRFFFTLFISTGTLFSGVVVLNYVVGIPAFGDFSDSFSLSMLLFFLLFTFLYSGLWTLAGKKFIGKLKKSTIFQTYFK